MFQIENGEKFQNGLEYPRLSEIGPFYFKYFYFVDYVKLKFFSQFIISGYRHRNILGWTPDKSLLKFNESFRWEFDESNSIGPLNMSIKTFNVALLVGYLII